MRLQAVRSGRNATWATPYDLARYTEALPPLTEAVHLKPDDAEALSSLALVYFALKCEAEALPSLTALVRLHPDEEWNHAMLGAANVRLARLAEALPELQEALRLDPNDVFARTCYNIANNMARLQPQLQRMLNAAAGMRQAFEGLYGKSFEF